MWKALPGRQEDGPSPQGFFVSFFFSAVSVSLLSFCSWLVGVFLKRHHILMLIPKTLFQHFPSHGFATPEPPAVAATSRRPPTLETQIQVTRLRKCHQYHHLTKVFFFMICPEGLGGISPSRPGRTSALPVVLHVGALGQVTCPTTNQLSFR